MTPQPHVRSMEGLSLPLQLADGTVAIVRRLSPDMLYLELDAARPLHGPLVLEMRMPQARACFVAEARVICVIPLGPICGIQMQLSNLRLQPQGDAGRIVAMSQKS